MYFLKRLCGKCKGRMLLSTCLALLVVVYYHSVSRPALNTKGMRLVGASSGTSMRTRSELKQSNNGIYAKNGNDTYSFYMYSAFWDDRDTLDTGPLIRIIVLTAAKSISWETIEPDVRCYVSCEGGLVEEITPVFANSRIVKPGNVKRMVVDRRLVSCKTDLCSDGRAEYVSIGFGNVKPIGNTKDKFSVPVEFADKTNTPLQLATCRPAMFNFIDPYSMVEWFELQRLLGVEKVIIYNGTLVEESSRIIRHYVAQNFAEVRQMDGAIFEKDNLDDVIYTRNALSFSDCIYRYMYRFKNIMGIDSDEIIMPMATDKLTDLIKELDSRRTVVNGTLLRVDYTFKGGYFKMQEPDLRMPNRSVFLRYRVRRPLTGIYVKSIINPMGCLTARNHYCTNKLPYYAEYKGGHTRIEKPQDAYVFHHRSHMQFDNPDRGEDVTENKILTYADKLIPNINKQLHSLSL